MLVVQLPVVSIHSKTNGRRGKEGEGRRKVMMGEEGEEGRGGGGGGGGEEGRRERG